MLVMTKYDVANGYIDAPFAQSINSSDDFREAMPKLHGSIVASEEEFCSYPGESTRLGRISHWPASTSPALVSFLTG